MGSATPDGVTSTGGDDWSRPGTEGVAPVVSWRMDPGAQRVEPSGRGAEAIRLGELAAARLLGEPEEAERYLRAALESGAGALPAEHLARLHAQLVTVLSGLPGREADLAAAALAAAGHWADLSGDTVTHLVFVAARAWHRAGRHRRAAELFARAIAAPAPYPAAEMAVLRGQYGRSLRLLGEHARAARHYLAAAHLVRDAADHACLRAELTWSAASALDACGADGPAALAYLRAADLWGELGRIGPRARCLRSAAWLRFWSAGTRAQRQPSIDALRALLADLEGLAPSPEVANELDHTRRQLADMQD